MDEELKRHLDAMEARINARFETMEERVNSRFEIMQERIETSETRLLREFWKWARTADARYRQHQGVVNGLAERVQIVEDRLADLEREEA